MLSVVLDDFRVGFWEGSFTNDFFVAVAGFIFRFILLIKSSHTTQKCCRRKMDTYGFISLRDLLENLLEFINS